MDGPHVVVHMVFFLLLGPSVVLLSPGSFLTLPLTTFSNLSCSVNLLLLVLGLLWCRFRLVSNGILGLYGHI